MLKQQKMSKEWERVGTGIHTKIGRFADGSPKEGSSMFIADLWCPGTKLTKELWFGIVDKLVIAHNDTVSKPAKKVKRNV